MKVILYTYDIMKIGGIETSFYSLANYLKSKGHDVVVRYSIADPMRVARYREAGIDIDRQKSEVCDILFIGSIWKRPNDIVARLVCQQAHADWSDDFWTGAEQAVNMIKDADGESDVFVPVSNSSASFISGYTDKPIVVMNNLAPRKMKIEKVKHDKLVIAAFTRMSLEKGLSNYEALATRLEALGIDAELRVYTTGKVPRGWLPRNLVPDIKTELAGVDFVASLPDTESFGYAIAEANSCGIPCIIKRCNSTTEFFNDSSNIIVDSILDLTAKDLCRTIKVKYELDEITRLSVDKAMDKFEIMIPRRAIIKCMKSFRDLKTGKQRKLGELFAVDFERADELVNHPLRLAVEI